MSDRNRELNQASLDLADALRALPLQAPQRSAWPELAAKLHDAGRREVQTREVQTRERIRRFIVPAALAAALAGVFVVAHRAQSPKPQTTATVAALAASSNTNSATAGGVRNVATDAAQLAKLQQRSQDLERWLRDTGAAAMPLQGQDLVAATEIENLIGLVDVELAAPQETRDAGLWQRRVALLEDLSALRYSNYELAAGGGRVLAASLTN